MVKRANSKNAASLCCLGCATLQRTNCRLPAVSDLQTATAVVGVHQLLGSWRKYWAEADTHAWSKTPLHSSCDGKKSPRAATSELALIWELVIDGHEQQQACFSQPSRGLGE